MRPRKHLTYANVVATAVLFAVVAGGGAYAATKIGTAQLKAGAVTTSKLHRGAVTAGKIAPTADGVALAGLSVGADGSVLTSFNRLADDPAPGVFHPSPGRYELAVPGTDSDTPLDPTLPGLQIATLAGDQGGEVSTTTKQTSAGLGLVVITRASAGNPADRAFNWALFRIPGT
jgi:hypothetical protein